MLPVLFRRELDEVFRIDRSIRWKMGGCAVATVFVVVVTTIRGVLDGRLRIELSAPLIAALVVASAAIGALLALALALKDVVQRRLAHCDPVNPLLVLYFGMGVWSLIAWFPTVIIVALVITVATAL